MSQEYWQHQTNDPLFPNLLWSRPENKLGAGKLLIIGGQAQEFSNVAAAFSEAEKAGAGVIRVIMPESTRQYTKFLLNIEYALSNPSGSFARSALAELLDAADRSDGVLLAGDLGKNSETSLMLEHFIMKYPGFLVIARQSLGSLSLPVKTIFQRPNTLLLLSKADMQKAGIELNLEQAITSEMGIATLAKLFHELTTEYPVHLLMGAGEFTMTSSQGRVVSTKNKNQFETDQLAARAAVWSIQHPGKVFEAMTTAVFC